MDILIKNIGYLSKECNECLRTYIAMNDGDENLIGSLRVDCKSGSVDCPLVALPEHGELIDRSFLKGASYEIIRFSDEEANNMFLELIDNAPTIVEANNGTDS